MVSADPRPPVDSIPVAISAISSFVETLTSAIATAMSATTMAATTSTHSGSAKRPLEYQEEVQAAKRMRNE
jgi:hypothetical protein